MIHLKHMALRVLLADDSSTIKKVIQLALQDFGVEVKAVPIGLDVESVTRLFKPDLILADVLLVKKNGYEIAQDFKQNPDFKAIPIVLMWSGFLAFDQDKFIQSKAEDKIEKPFDAETLRQIVRKHVTKLQSNKIAPFLSYNLPEFVEEPARNHHEPVEIPKIELPLTTQRAPSSFNIKSVEPISEESLSLPLPPLPPLPQLDTFRAEPGAKPSDITHDLDDIDEFQQIPLPGRKKSSPAQEDWSLKKSFESQDPIFAKSISIPDPFSIDISDALISTMGEKDITIPLIELAEEEIESDITKLTKPNLTSSSSMVKALPQNIDPLRLEEMLREQVQDVLKEIAWRVVPDIAERVVREEMQRLLKEAERLP